MSDKELDELFKQKFGSYEPEVSPGLWDRIDRELGASAVGEGKKKFPVVWMAAASVAVVLTCGVWLFRSQPVVDQHQQVVKTKTDYQPGNRPEVVRAQRPAETEALADVLPEEVKAAAPVQHSRLAAAISKRAATVSATPVLVSQPDALAAKQTATLAVNTDVKPAADDAPAPTRQPLKNVTVTSLMASANQQQQPAVIAANPSLPDEQEQPKAKIRSIGGLVNFVVSKVDKRDEKLIEFEDSGEGDVVSGINLGLLKFKGKKHIDHNRNNSSTNK